MIPTRPHSSARDKADRSARTSPETEGSEHQEIDASYESSGGGKEIGRTHISLEITLPKKSQIKLRIDSDPTGNVHVSEIFKPTNIKVTGKKTSFPLLFSRFRVKPKLPRSVKNLEVIIFVLALSVYFITRVIALDDFPIYFFTDEAIQTVSAEDLIQADFHGPDGTFLPTYFQNGNFFNLSASVYLQVIPLLVFGKSILVTRMVTVLISLIPAIALGLLLRSVYKARYWWMGIIFLSITPAWFLHSRTAFETALFTSFFAGFLWFYVLYRERSPKFLSLAILFGALSFYSYSPGQVVIALTGLGLLILDFRYHLRSWRFWLFNIPLVILSLFPYVRFIADQSEAPFSHLRNLDSYWMHPIPISQKIIRFFREYFYGLSPTYWFFPNQHDLVRHLMKGYGHILWWTLPFVIIGVIWCIKGIRSTPGRIVLLAIFATPAGSALVGIGITRVLVMVIPISIAAGIGFSEFVKWLEAREWVPVNKILKKFGYISTINKTRFTQYFVASIYLFMVIFNFSMVWDVVEHSPRWYDDYGLYGMQYGSRQIFGDAVPEYLARSDVPSLYVSSLWTNGADVLPRFFLDDNLLGRVYLGSIDTYLSNYRPFDERMIFILTREEYDQIKASNKLYVIEFCDVIQYPNNTPGFYILRLAYVQNVEQIFEQERIIRRELVNGEIEYRGQRVALRYSMLDGGQLLDMFDGDFFTLARGMEANPFIFEFLFANPTALEGVSVDLGSMDVELTVEVWLNLDDKPIVFSQSYTNLPPDPHVELWFDPRPINVVKIRLAIHNLKEGEFAKNHIRDVKILP